MKKSIVFFVALGCFFLSNCGDVGSRYGNGTVDVDRMVLESKMDFRLSWIEQRLDDCEERLKKIDGPLFGRLSKVEKSVERLTSEEVSMLWTSNLTTHERLKRIENKLGILQE